MELSSRILHLGISVEEAEALPSFQPDDVILLFAALDRLTGLVLNHNHPSECFVIFTRDTYIADILKLTGTMDWLRTHIDLTLEKPRTGLVLMIDRLLADKPLKEGEGFEYILIDPAEPVEPTPHSTPKKGGTSAAAMLVDNLKKLSSEELKQILSSVSHEMEGRRVPTRSLIDTSP